MDLSKVGCQKCGKQLQVMKRCTRCQSLFYCSSECQREDWPNHKSYCNKATKTPKKHTAKDEAVHQAIADSTKDIWDRKDVDPSTKSREPFKIEWNNNQSSNKSNKSNPPKYCTTFVNFSQAAKDLKKGTSEDSPSSSPGPSSEPNKGYLNDNTMVYDLPVLDRSKECVAIIIKANRTKYNVEVNNTEWSGAQVFKVLSSTLSIPLDRLKLIHKGKKVDETTIIECLRNKALFQAIGEQAEDESGLNGEDIDVMMKQLHVDRNEAVKALRNEGDLLDAMLKVANK